MPEKYVLLEIGLGDDTSPAPTTQLQQSPFTFDGPGTHALAQTQLPSFSFGGSASTSEPSPVFGETALPSSFTNTPSTFTLPGSGGTFKFPSNAVPARYNNTAQSYSFPSTFGQPIGVPVGETNSNNMSGLTLPSKPVPVRAEPVLQRGVVAPLVAPLQPPSVQQDKFTSALDFLEEVKKAFADRPLIYSSFLDIMKDFKSQA